MLPDEFRLLLPSRLDSFAPRGSAKQHFLSSILAMTLWVHLVEQGSGVVLPCIVATATRQNHNKDFFALYVFVRGRTGDAMRGTSRQVATGKHVIHTGISGVRSVDARTGIC